MKGFETNKKGVKGLAALLLYLMEEQIEQEENDCYSTKKRPEISKILSAMQEKFRNKRRQITQIKGFIQIGKARKDELLANLLSE